MGKKVHYDDDRVLFALQKAPHIFTNELAHWLNKERVNFLGYAVRGGKAKSDGGGIRGKLLNKKRFGRPGGWEASVVGQFKSMTEDKNTLHPKMTMKFAENSPLFKAMQLEESGGGSTNSKFMPIPIYRNLAAIGVIKGYHKNFQEKAEANQLVPIRPKGRPDLMLWFYNRFGNNLLLYVGKKAITVKKQFDFHRAWEKRKSKAVSRGEQAIFRATRLVEKMIKGGYFQTGAANG